jgi:hypothetical protein
VNRIWVKDLDLGRADAAFFGTGQGAEAGADWTVLRDRWEQSHVARAACAAVAFLLLSIAVAL